MTLLDIKGRLVSKNSTRFLIKWDEKSRSKIQFKVKQFLKPFWKTQIVYEEFPVYGTQMKVDILNATHKIAIEVNGIQHEEFSEFFHGHPVNYLKSFNRDSLKRNWLEENGFKLIEIRQSEIDSISREFFKEKFDLIL